MPTLKDEHGNALITNSHPDYDVFHDDWNYIDKVMSGRGVECEIPKLNPCDKSDENAHRNAQYRERAVFLRIAGRTANRMIGLVFMKWPTLRVPPELDYVAHNVDGAGTSIYQQSQAALKSVVSKGRAGLLVEYPLVNEEVTRDDMERRKYYATIQRFEPQQIINWSAMRVGANMALDRVVLKDMAETSDGFVEIIRELTLEWRHVFEHEAIDAPVYVSREWRQVENSKGDMEWSLVSETVPLDGFGEPWDRIPFEFIGSETNLPRVSEPPMIDICKANICHYRLHADYMDSCHYVGQPQGYVNGIEDIKCWTDDMKENGWYSGSRQMAVLPPGGVVGYASVPANTMVKEALDSTKNDLIGMGAFYITPGSAIKTATQAAGEQEEQHSVLSLAASNVSEAYSRALVYMARFMRVELYGAHVDADGKTVDDTPLYDLRREFTLAAADPQLIQAMWTLVMQGGMPKSDFWRSLRKAEIIDPEKDDEEIREEIEAEQVSLSMPDLEPDEGDDDEAEVAALEAAHPELSDMAGA